MKQGPCVVRERDLAPAAASTERRCRDCDRVLGARHAGYCCRVRRTIVVDMRVRAVVNVRNNWKPSESLTKMGLIYDSHPSPYRAYYDPDDTILMDATYVREATTADDSGALGPGNPNANFCSQTRELSNTRAAR